LRSVDPRTLGIRQPCRRPDHHRTWAGPVI
jgi:hypothetical protein